MGLFDDIIARNKYAVQRGKVMKGGKGNKRPNKSGLAGKNKTMKKANSVKVNKNRGK